MRHLDRRITDTMHEKLFEIVNKSTYLVRTFFETQKPFVSASTVDSKFKRLPLLVPP